MARPAPRSGGQKRPKPKKEPFPKCFPEDKLGKYLRLHPLRLRELPAHPQFTGWVDPKAGASPPTSSSQRPARPVAARPSVEAPTTAMHTAAPSPEPDPAPTARSTDLTVSPERDPTPSALSTDLRIQTNPGHLASDPAAVLSTSNDGQPTRARSASNPVEYGAAAEPSTARPTTAHPSLAIATQVATAPAVPKDQPPARTSLTIAPPDASAPAVPKGLPSPALSKRDEPALAASEITPSPPHSTVEFQDDRVVPGTGPEATNASNAETSRYGDNARSNLKSTSRFKKIRGGRPTGAGLSKERERSPSSASTRQGGQRPGLMDFIVALYKEAKEFTSDTVCHTFEKTKSKSSESSSARVQLLRRTISRERLSNIRWEDSRTHREPPAEHDYKTEHWHVRRSWHRPSKQPGTADISEFNRGLAVNHSINEMEYTPDIYEAHEVQTWDDQLKGMEFSNPEITEARMTLFEMCHKLPWPLAPRVFPTLVVVIRSSLDLFYIVSIPMNMSIGTPLSPAIHGYFSAGRNVIDLEEEQGIRSKETVTGRYCSVERVTLYTDEKDGEYVDWMMATASDAGGSLPVWVQELGIPSAIAKDVGFFMSWIAKRRSDIRRGEQRAL